MFLKTESEVTASKLSIPQTHFDLQYVRPDFIMLRVIAQNLIMWSRVHPSGEWIQSQIPKIVKIGVANLGDENGETDEIDVEALVQAYVNILAGSCISLREKKDPFNGGTIYIKRKVGACSYVDNPVGCQSLLSRAIHKVCDLESLRSCATSGNGNSELGLFEVDQLVYVLIRS
ncbi:hypothetical protein MKX03_028211 [Papaver bracteatum]|nr:hypothetical protein MKX03_028211 [Papaver bracteatum]